MNLVLPVAEPRLIVAGGAHVDRRARPLGVFVPAASNPGAVEVSVGGAAFNAALALRMMGADVAYLGARGGDADGALVVEALDEAGIGDHAMTWLDRRTPGYTAVLDERGELVAGIADMRLYDLLSPRVFSRRHIREVLAAADALLLDANLPEASIRHLAETFEGRPLAAIAVSPVKARRLAAILPLLSALFLSRAEALSLTGAADDASVQELARQLAEAGLRAAIVTDGPREAAILEDGVVALQAPPAVARLRDVTGAGDTLAGVAFFALLQGEPMLAAARLGMAAASLRIAASPPQRPSLPARIRAIADALPPAKTLA